MMHSMLKWFTVPWQYSCEYEISYIFAAVSIPSYSIYIYVICHQIRGSDVFAASFAMQMFLWTE